MPNDAARREALGQTTTELHWRGRHLTIPFAVEDWPLDTIRVGRPLVAVDILLTGQPIGMRAPLIDDYRDLSDAMAEACGVGRLPEQPGRPGEWFGGVPKLLRYLDRYEAEVESDLLSRWGLDYTDRWRLNEHNQPRLTLRRIWSCIRRSLPTSAVAVADNGGHEVWTAQTFATARVWEALTGRMYEGRPFTDAELAKAVEAMQRKQAHVDKLKARRAAYHPEQQQQAPTDPRLAVVYAAANEAITNRRSEIGASDTDGPQLN